MINFEISEHAYERMKERCGWNRKAATKMAKLGYEDGINHRDTVGKLYAYIAKQAKKHMKKGACFKLYGEFVFCFVRYIDVPVEERKIVLISVWRIPNELKKQALGVQRKK